MAKNCKSREIESMLEKRIRNGNYHFVKFPSERALAEQENVTQVTARKAIIALEKRGLLRRNKNGTTSFFESVDPEVSRQRFVVLLAPAYPSKLVFDRLQTLTTAAQTLGWNTRLVLYTHWTDPIIKESLNNFDGAFLLPLSEEMPESVREMLVASPVPLIALAADLKEFGLRSAFRDQDAAMEVLITYLQKLGHRKIDCLNTQPSLFKVNLTVQKWQDALTRHGLTGELHNHPVTSFGHTHEQAADDVKHLLAQGKLQTECLFCTTEGAAIGASRALLNAGLMPGADLSLCTLFDEGMCQYFHPSITSCAMQGLAEEMASLIRWMQNGNQSEMEFCLGRTPKLFVGESTRRPKR